MKKIPSLAFFALFTLTVIAPSQAKPRTQTPFFLCKQGSVAEYSIKSPDGTVMYYAKSTVTRVDATDEQNFTASYTAEAFDANRNKLTEPMPMSIVVKDGTVEMMPNTMGMKFEGKAPSYPSNLTVGQEFEYDFSLKAMGVEAATKGKEKVVARESVTTPAGTFDAFKIESEVTVTAMTQTIKMKTVAWLSAGVGNVRIETRDADGNLQMTHELISLKQ